MLPALQVEDSEYEGSEYVCANFHVSLYDLILHLGSYWECVSVGLG